jgi:hypothetical protein
MPALRLGSYCGTQKTIWGPEVGGRSPLISSIHSEHRKWPALSDTQITMADASLDREYMKKLQQLRTQTKESIDEGAVTADHVSSVEETWEKYRDAWVAFARLRYPAAVAAIRAEITLDRYRLLKTIR